MTEWQPNNGRLKQGYEKDPGVLPSKEGAGFLQTGKQAVIRGIVPVG